MPISISATLRRIADVILRRDAARDLDEEFRFHVDMQTESNVRLGVPPDEARRRALVAFGGRARFADEVRDERRGRVVEDLERDVRLALRGLRREPGFAASVVLSLALGLGATGAVFALAYGVLLRPLPFPSGDHLVTLGHVAPGLDVASGGQSEGTYGHYRERARSFDAVGTYFERVLTITDDAVPERVAAALVTPGVLRMLGVRAAHGRVFGAAEEAVDAPPAVVLSHELWTRRYGGDRSIIGRTIEINRRPRTVVGVMPRGFAFPSAWTRLWFSMPEATAERADVRDLYMTGLARLRAGVGNDEAEAELAALVPALADAYPDVTPALLAGSGLRPVVRPLRAVLTDDVRPALLLVAGTVGVVLLVTWANVASLALVRAERRRRRAAVAQALGASRARLLRADLVDGALVAAAGGALALLATWGATTLRFGFAPAQLPRLDEVRVDAPTFLVIAALAVASAVLVGLAQHAWGGVGAGAELRAASGRVGTSRERARARRALVAAQVALSVALLVAGGVMAQSYRNLRAAELGFRPDRIATFEIALPFGPYPRYHDAAGYFARLLDSLRAQPGVVAAEATSQLPLTLSPEFAADAVAPGEHPTDPSAVREAIVVQVSAGYFAAMATPLVRGRTFAAGDLQGERPAAVLSAALARTLFRDADPIGRTVRLGARAARQLTVVGVAADVPGATIADGPARLLYVPMLDEIVDAAGEARVPRYPRELSVIVRTTAAPEHVVLAARRVARAVDAKVPVANVRTLDELVDAATVRARLTAILLLAAAAAALGLGVVGIYGVVAYAVTLRTHEFGLRLALGAQPGALHRHVLGQGLAVAAVGVAAGVGIALSLARALRGLTYGIAPADPATVVAASALLLGAALVASHGPARRAMRADPAAALRAD